MRGVGGVATDKYEVYVTTETTYRYVVFAGSPSDARRVVEAADEDMRNFIEAEELDTQVTSYSSKEVTSK